MTSPKIIISLCDESLEWSRRFAERDGGQVYAVDPKHAERMDMKPGPLAMEATVCGAGIVTRMGMTVDDFIRWHLPKLVASGTIVGVIAQPVCTEFSGAGARHWKRKDTERPELLEGAKRLVSDCLHVVAVAQPAWWIMENPVGRMGRVCGLGKPVMSYQPHEYAHMAEGDAADEQYTKRTCLWGTFNADALGDMKGDLPPLVWGANGNTSRMHACYGGASAATKEARSKTPTGFAEAFWHAHD